MKAREVSKSSGAIAKWLRRQIRINYEVYLFLFEGAGSNPAGVVTACPLFGGRQPFFFFSSRLPKNILNPGTFEILGVHGGFSHF